MSAFFVQQIVIDKTVYCSLLDRHTLLPTWTKTADEYSDLGRALWRLNVEALRQRYGLDAEEEATYEVQIETYRYGLVNFKPLTALKGLHCWLYQCTEGSVPRAELYCRMTQLADSIARRIICRLPEYEAAAWDG